MGIELIIGLVSILVIVGLVIFMKKNNIEEETHKEEEIDRELINSKNDFKMVVEDVFTITGRGTVITGAIDSGLIRINEEVEIYGTSGFKRKTIVTGIEMFRKTLDFAQADDNVGLLLHDISSNDIEKGDLITKGR